MSAAPVAESPRGGALGDRLRNAGARDSGGQAGVPMQTLHVVLAVGSIVLIPLGLAILLLGWWGAARTGFVFEQVPYLISGGLLGVAFMVAGGMLYFGSWIARFSHQQQAHTAQLAKILEEVRDKVAEQPALALAAAPAAAASSSGRAKKATTRAAPSGRFVATPTGSMYHRPDCVVVADRSDVKAIDPTKGKNAEKYRPCKICEPDSELEAAA